MCDTLIDAGGGREMEEQCDKVATTKPVAKAENDIESRFLDKNLIQTMGGYVAEGVACSRISRCDTHTHTHKTCHGQSYIYPSLSLSLSTYIKNVPDARR